MTTKSNIHHASVIVRPDDILSSNIDSETILLHIQNSKYYGMDMIASRIWELLEHPMEVNAVIQTLLDEYDVTYEQCEYDVMQFLNELLEEQLLMIKDA